MVNHPSIAAQIEAVDLAVLKVLAIGRDSRMRESEIDLLRRRLQAAAETLRTLEFGREVLK